MAEAKQFATHRKVAPPKRINPLLAAISMPSLMKSKESALHKPDTKPVTIKTTNQHREEKGDTEIISDELADLITQKVLKNIKNYLNPPQREMGRHIKLEISL